MAKPTAQPLPKTLQCSRVRLGSFLLVMRYNLLKITLCSVFLYTQNQWLLFIPVFLYLTKLSFKWITWLSRTSQTTVILFSIINNANGMPLNTLCPDLMPQFIYSLDETLERLFVTTKCLAIVFTDKLS